MTAETMRNEITALMNRPTLTPARVTLPKSGCPPTLPMNPIITSVKVLTTVANAAPTMNATASSIRLPRITKPLKPLSMSFPSVGPGLSRDGRRLVRQHHREERRDRGLGHRRGVAVGHPEHDQGAVRQAGRLLCGPGDRQHRHVP